MGVVVITTQYGRTTSKLLTTVLHTLTGCCQVACLLALPLSQVAAHHVSLLRGDDLIQKFWEIDKKSSSTHVLIVEPCLAHHDENKVVRHKVTDSMSISVVQTC